MRHNQLPNYFERRNSSTTQLSKKEKNDPYNLHRKLNDYLLHCRVLRKVRAGRRAAANRSFCWSTPEKKVSVLPIRGTCRCYYVRYNRKRKKQKQKRQTENPEITHFASKSRRIHSDHFNRGRECSLCPFRSIN